MSDLKKLLNTLFMETTDSLLVQLFRYLFVGGTAFVVDFGLLFVLTDLLHMHYLLSAGLGFTGGLLTNYLLSVSWVFSRRKVNNQGTELLIFTIIGCVGLALNSLFMWLFTDIIGCHYLLSKVITTVIVMFWNFLVRKIALF